MKIYRPSRHCMSDYETSKFCCFPQRLSIDCETMLGQQPLHSYLEGVCFLLLLLLEMGGRRSFGAFALPSFSHRGPLYDAYCNLRVPSCHHLMQVIWVAGYICERRFPLLFIGSRFRLLLVFAGDGVAAMLRPGT
jgi:hypothetical protein